MRNMMWPKVTQRQGTGFLTWEDRGETERIHRLIGRGLVELLTCEDKNDNTDSPFTFRFSFFFTHDVEQNLNWKASVEKKEMKVKNKPDVCFQLAYKALLCLETATLSFIGSLKGQYHPGPLLWAHSMDDWCHLAVSAKGLTSAAMIALWIW